MDSLHKALTFNALFSGFSGLTSIVLEKQLAKVFGISSEAIFSVIGIGLIIFAATIVLQIKTKNSLGIRTIITLDYLWVLGSVMLLVVQPFEISHSGNIIMTVVAIIVLVLAIWQHKSLIRTQDKA